MTPRNEDFLFAQEAQRRGYVTEAQLEEGFLLQKRMIEELQIDERVAVILVKRGWLAEEQARRVYARIEPDSEHDEIEGYRIIEKLGRGSMGTVYKAEHLRLRRPVAIKILRRDLARDTTQVERLKEEAKLLASLDHPNIVRALDAGESRGFPFVVMEYAEGETLKERITSQGPLHEIDALRIARGLADALERARRMGIVHRDVKPGNIILTRKDEPKLMDLGLAKGPVDLGLTQHGATVGTPQFISPEQAQDPRRADTRSDIYSLGATLYAAVTGRPPFQGTTLAEVLTKVLYEAPLPPRVVNKKVSPEVGYLIERMMLKDPALRYRTPADVVRDIDEILAGRSIIPDGFTGNWEAYLLRRRIRKWTKIGAVMATAIVVLGVSTFLFVRHREHVRDMEKGEQAIQQALLDTAMEPTSDALAVQERLDEARDVYRHWAPIEPDGLDRLGRRLHALKRQAGYFVELAELGAAVDSLVDAGRYDLAAERIQGFAKRIGGEDAPARRAAMDLERSVVVRSAGEAERLRSGVLRQATSTLGDLDEQQRAYAKALRQGLYVTPTIQIAREEADQAVWALEETLEGIGRLESEFCADSLAARLEDLGLAEVSKDFEFGRRDVMDAARHAWAKLDGKGWIPWTVVGPLVTSRLDRVGKRVDALVDQRGRAVCEEAKVLHGEGRTQAGLDLLTRLANAARRANYQRLRADALDLHETLQQKLDSARESATVALRTLEKDVRRLLREGRPEAIRKRVDVLLADRDPHWPLREEVAGLTDLADAYEALCGAALDGLVERGHVEKLLLRDGTRERRWFIEGVDRADGSVTVATAKGGAKTRRSLTEVDPEQLAEWAKPPHAPLAPMLRAVASLAALSEDDPEDLRKRVERFLTVQTAFEAAGYRGGLADWVMMYGARVRRDQNCREADTRAALQAARSLVLQREEYSDALFHLGQLRAPGSDLQKTDAYEKHRDQIEALWDRVTKLVANLKLAERFPGAKLGLDGEMTWMLLDFESIIQLECFRRGEAKATGWLESYAIRQAVTPTTTNWRFHLLWGMDGLVRDRPLVLPCIFDPAESIVVEFDLHTLDSPFFLIVDVDGLQVGILSADPTSDAYRGRWRFPPDVPLLHEDEKPPRIDFYGRGRGVAFHAGKGFGDPRDPRQWEWPALGRGRNHDRWRQSKRLFADLFAFEPGEVYHVKVVRDRGRITLFVDDRQVASAERGDWTRIGRTSDRDRNIRGKGTGLLQILTWTPQAIDNLRLKGIVLDRYRAD